MSVLLILLHLYEVMESISESKLYYYQIPEKDKPTDGRSHLTICMLKAILCQAPGLSYEASGVRCGEKAQVRQLSAQSKERRKRDE